MNGCSCPGRHRGRERGFTLIELVIVIAIAGVLAALAGPDISANLGRYRLNGAARELEAEVEACRLRAITENREYALQFVSTDPDPERAGGPGAGVYRVMSGERSAGSTQWDVLPSGAASWEGTHDLSAVPGGWRGVGIETVTPLAGPPGYDLAGALVFSPRGYLLNPPADLPNGEARVVLRNRAANPRQERRAVLVRRGGDARIVQPASE